MLLGSLVLALIWGGACAWSVHGARESSLEARRRVVAVRADPPSSVEELRRELDLVAAAIDDTSGRLDAPWLRIATPLPVLGRQVTSARSVAADTVEGVAVLDEVLAAFERATERLQDPADRAPALRSLATVASSAAAQLRGLDFGSGRGLLAMVADARDDVVRDIAEIAHQLELLATTAEAFSELFDEPSRYLVLAANNAQMQNGNGMFLSAGELHVGDGEIRLPDMVSTADLPPPPTAVALEPALRERWGWLDPNADFRHLGVSPRFPVTAATARDLWRATTGTDVAGVVSVDVVALRAVLEAVGPVAHSRGVVDAGNVMEFLLHDQYVEFPVGVDPRQAERRSLLSEIASAAMNRLSDRFHEVDIEGLRALADAIAGRHLMVWSADPAQQARWEALGASGSIDRSSLMLSAINRSGVKLDWFLRMEATVEVEPRGSSSEVVVRVEVTNTAPVGTEPVYVVGPYPGSGLDEGTYLGVLALTLPDGAAGAAVDGETALPVVGAEGPSNRVVGARIEVPAGRTVTRTFRFTIPSGRFVVEPGARAFPTRWHTGGESFLDDRRRDIEL